MRHTRAGKCRPRSLEGLPVLTVRPQRRKGCGRDDHMTDVQDGVVFLVHAGLWVVSFPAAGRDPRRPVAVGVAAKTSFWRGFWCFKSTAPCMRDGRCLKRC